jgi:hypothetical protein
MMGDHVAQREGWGAVIDAVNGLRDELGEKHTVQSQAISDLQSTVADLTAAFPEGDLDLHRRMHEAMIQKEKERAAFYTDLRSDLAKKGLWAVILAVSGVALAYLRAHKLVPF